MRLGGVDVCFDLVLHHVGCSSMPGGQPAEEQHGNARDDLRFLLACDVTRRLSEHSSVLGLGRESQ